MNKILFKKKHHHCAICNESTYELLDVHRINEGQEYSNGNCVVLCVSCHRKHHSGLIEIKEKRLSTNGWVLMYEENGKEIIKEL